MKTISIRMLDGRRLQEAARSGEIVGVTSDRVLCALLVPIRQRFVDQLVERHRSEILHGVELGEQSLDHAPSLEQLGEAPQRSQALPRSGARMTPVGIRQLSAGRIEAAAAAKEVLGVTNNRQLLAVLVPISQRWLDQVVHESLSRIVKGVLLGEQEVAAGAVRDLDDVGEPAGAGAPGGGRVAVPVW